MSDVTVLVVDDENLVLDYLSLAMQRLGYKATQAGTAEQAIELLDKHPFDMVLSDLKLPGLSGMDVLDHVKKVSPETPFILLTAYGSIENAVEAMQRGAYHYLTKPVDNKLLKLTVARALERKSLIAENRVLRDQVDRTRGLKAIVGDSKSLELILDTLERVAAQPVDVLISGGSGTGKELVARALHWSSPRRNKPFIKMNCAALPEGLVESELFGHEKGAFTGAIKTRKGKFEAADGGTILLDEISEMPMPLQAKLLRVLQEREFERVGSNDTIKVDVRVLATTNRNLAQEVKDGNFREDLFFRLNVVPIHLPPLAERPDDVPALVAHFVHKYGDRYGREFEGIDDDAVDYLKAQPWPGNVRELENRVERAVVLAQDMWIHKSDVQLEPHDLQAPSTHTGFGQLPLHEVEKQHILKTLNELDFNRTKAAKRLSISIRTLRNKLNEYRTQGEDIPKGN